MQDMQGGLYKQLFNLVTTDSMQQKVAKAAINTAELLKQRTEWTPMHNPTQQCNRQQVLFNVSSQYLFQHRLGSVVCTSRCHQSGCTHPACNLKPSMSHVQVIGLSWPDQAASLNQCQAKCYHRPISKASIPKASIRVLGIEGTALVWFLLTTDLIQLSSECISSCTPFAFRQTSADNGWWAKSRTRTICSITARCHPLQSWPTVTHHPA